MIIRYEFNTEFLGSNDEYCEEYWETEPYEYEPSLEEEMEVAVESIMQDMKCNEEMATEIMKKVLWDYDLLDEYLEANEDFAKDYLEYRARKKFYSEE